MFFQMGWNHQPEINWGFSRSPHLVVSNGWKTDESKAYMGQNLGHGNFHPEQYMGAAAAMAHIPPGAFPQGVTNGDPWGFKGFKDEREEIRRGKFFSFFLVSPAEHFKSHLYKVNEFD